MATAHPILRQLQWLSACIALALLAACGGGGDDRGCVDVPNRDPRLPSCSGDGGTNPPPVPTAMSLALLDASGNATTSISPTKPGFVEATVKDVNGNAAPNVPVDFRTTDATGGFSPPSASALTDSNGVAKVTLLAGSVAGAFTLSASTAGTNPGTVSGGGTAAAVPASTASLGYAVSSPNLPTSALGSIKFLSAEPTRIALRGTGGAGRQEFSTLTFQVFDQTAHPVQRAQVNFTLNTTVGGLSLQPQSALTDATGKVTTVVSAGTIPTPAVIVTASVPSSGISVVSNVLVVSTGLATDARTSLSVATGNIEGWNFDGVCTDVTVRAGDHFGNPAVDGTTVSYSGEYGVTGPSCTFGDGGCSARHCSAGNRPPGGRATVVAYLRGEEDFFDANGNNVCDGCTSTSGAEFKPSHDLRPDVIRDDDENGAWSAGEPCISPSGNPACSTPPDGAYNGVLASPAIPAAQQTIYLRRQYVAIWSGSFAYITFAQDVACGFSPLTAGSITVHLRIVDLNGNPMPAGTQIEVTGAATASFTVPNYVVGIGQSFGTGPGQIPAGLYDLSLPCTAAGSTLTVTVTTPRGIVTMRSFSVG